MTNLQQQRLDEALAEEKMKRADMAALRPCRSGTRRFPPPKRRSIAFGIVLPLTPPISPQLALSRKELPDGDGWAWRRPGVHVLAELRDGCVDVHAD